MIFSMPASERAYFGVISVDVKGLPSPATLTNFQFTSFNPELINVAQNASDPESGIVNGLGVAGSAVLIAAATVTGPDGTTRTIRGATSVILT
jgi:hypothetical protein